jgi:hypothetical protein
MPRQVLPVAIGELVGLSAGSELATTSTVFSLLDSAKPVGDAGWSVEAGSDAATASIVTLEEGDIAIALETGSPISIERDLSVPDGGTMSVFFDYQFVNVGTLDIFLDDELLQSITATEEMSAFQQYTIGNINLTDFGSSPTLRFTFDALDAEQLLLLQNIGTTFNGSSAVIESFQKLQTVPVPASATLIGIGLVGLGYTRRKRFRRLPAQ